MTTLLISDTHGRHIYSDINDRKDLNMIIHCGDFTKSKRKGKEGLLDKTLNNRTVGSKTLLRKIKELKSLKFHFFGHIHEAKGRIIEDNVTFINSSDDCLNKYHIEKVNIIDI